MQECCNKRNSKVTLIAYILRLLKVPFTNKNLRGIFWTHPDRDNLLGYARILSYYGIKINAKIIDSLDSIDKQELPYLSYLTDYKFVLIENFTYSDVLIHDGFRKKRLSRTKFINQWNGVVLQLKKTETAIEPFYQKNRKRTFEKVALFFVFFILTLILVAAQHLVIFSIKTLINIGVNIIACHASITLFNKSFIPFEKPNICSILNIFQCNLPKKNIFKIDLSDIGISYFGTAIVVSLLFPTLYPELSVYYILAIPFSLWSIFYQWIWIKKICPYCTIIQILVLFLALYNLEFTFGGCIRFIDVIAIAVIFMVLLLLIETLYRPYYENIVALFENTYNLNVCKTKLIKQKLNDKRQGPIYDEAPHDIELGMECASNNLTIVINLHCHSCGVEFIKSYNLLKLSRTVKTKFVVACWSKEQKYDFSILLSLHTPTLPIDKLIFDWFYFGREKFIKHYCKKNKSKDSTKNYIILSHYKWFKNNHIGETPTYILNGEKLPSGITILDIINAC